MKTKRTSHLLLVTALLIAPVTVLGDILYVDADATGQGTGSSWEHAFSGAAGLESALSAAQSGDTIRVAAGVYSTPIRLENGVALLGGYAGAGQEDPDHRDLDLHETVIDVAGSFHAVDTSGTDATAVLDGFVIKGGNASASRFPNSVGGGIFNLDGSPTIKNCTVIGNSARSLGGGMYTNGGSPRLINCRFLGNSSFRIGGGIAFEGGDPPTSLTAINCVFSGNSGGAYYQCSDGPALLVNCSFSGNEPDGIVSLFGECAGELGLHNSIVWGNSERDLSGEADVTYSAVGDWPGGGIGNISSDPLFVDADGPDDTPGTEDDDLRLWYASPCVDAGTNDALPPDTADLDQDGDTAEPLPLDLALRERRVDQAVITDTGEGIAPLVDMGALESYLECGPVIDEETDCDGNDKVDSCEIASDPALDCNANGAIDRCEVFALLREATRYKSGFTDCGSDPVYADAVHNYLDNRASIDQAFLSAFQAARCLAGDGSDESDALLDATYEKAVLTLLLAQESEQAAVDDRFQGAGLGSIESEIALLEDAFRHYDRGIRVFLGGSAEDLETDGVLADFHEIFEAFGPTRTPWDECDGAADCCADDPSESQPYRELCKLAPLYAGQLEALDRQAELFRFKASAEGAQGDDSIDLARQAIVRGQARGFIGQLVLADQLPADRFEYDGDNVEGSLLRLGSAFRDLETRASRIERRAVNALGVNPEFVQFIYFPERDPILDPDPETGEPRNNFTQWLRRLDGSSGALTRALQAEAMELDADREFEGSQASFITALAAADAQYVDRLGRLEAGFVATEAQIERNLLELERAQNEMSNIFSRMQIEQDRVARRAGARSSIGGQIARVFLDTGESLAANEIALGEINAANAKKDGIFEALSSFGLGASESGPMISFNPGGLARGIYQAVEGYKVEKDRAELQADNRRLQALEKARVQYLEIRLENRLEQIDSEAAIKRMLLEIANAAIGVRLKSIDLHESLARLQGIAGAIAATRAKQKALERGAQRLFADPSFRLIRDATRARAIELFEEAQLDTYLAARALEYETAQPSDSLPDIFTARTALELSDIVSALDNEWQAFQSAHGARIPTQATISLREDIFGFRFGDVDPDTGEPLDPAERFREFLRSTSAAPDVHEVTFYGAMNEWGPDKDNPEVDIGRLISWRIPRRFFNSKIQSINVRLEGNFVPGSSAFVVLNLGGHAWIRSSVATEKPPATATDPWNYEENIVKSQVLSYGPDEAPRDLDRTVPVQVGAGDVEKPFWGLFNRSPVRKWDLILNLADPVNLDIELDDIDDIVLEVSFRSHELP